MQISERKRMALCEAFAANAVLCKLQDKEALYSDPGFEIRAFSSGQVIFSPDDYQNAFAVVIKGSVLVSKENDGSCVVMKKTGVGGGFGAAALFGNVGRYASTITAASRVTEIAMISEEAMKKLLMREPDVAVAYIGFLSDRIRYLNAKIDSFASGSAGNRLAKFLLAESPCEISMQRLSQILGVSRVTLYREMEKLENAGAVKRDGKYICITNKESFEKFL